MKGESPHEIILLYALGFKPIHIINLGYPAQTVYKYNKYFEKAKENLKIKLIKGYKNAIFRN